MSNATAPAAQRIAPILETLARAYPNATCSLHYRTPLELLIATILSAQCTDVLVNRVTPALFKKYRTAADYATAPREQLAQDISRINFYRMKTASIQAACRTLVERFGGRVPNRMEDLVQLKGVARKTANVVLGNAFNIPAGIVVDTHVLRLAERLRLSSQRTREKVEQELMTLVPKPQWIAFGHRMIAHGRSVCTAQSPKCCDCPLGKPLCPSYAR